MNAVATPGVSVPTSVKTLLAPSIAVAPLDSGWLVMAETVKMWMNASATLAVRNVPMFMAPTSATAVEATN